MAWTRAALRLVAAGAVGLALVSGGSPADPRTPAGLPGMPAPFLGTAVVGSGGVTAAIDAYGGVVDLRVPGPAGRALIDNPADRQAAGSVPAETGIVPRISIGGGQALPLWRADSVAQRYLPGTDVVRTEARFGRVEVAITDAAFGQELARILSVSAPPGLRASPSFGIEAEVGSNCRREFGAARIALVCGAGGSNSPAAAGIVRKAIAGDRRWIAQAEPLGAGAPAWARQLHRRSLLILRALTDHRTGAVAAGARDGWAYVWPRDAGTAALAYAAAGYQREAERASRFLLGLGLEAAARYHGNGRPVAGRAAQGDAVGWVAAAAQAAGSIGNATHAARILSSIYPTPWGGRADYQEGDSGDYLGNAIASGGPLAEFQSGRGLVRRAGDPGSGLDSAAAWAVRPFPRPQLFAPARRTLHRLAEGGTPFGIVPGAAWPGKDPWTAPTAWSAWSLAALASEDGGTRADRRAALRLLGDLRRAATRAGALPERVDVRTGIPVSTTPLAWSHAFSILALRELWPDQPQSRSPLVLIRPQG